jgi:hypothetical protein
MAIGDTPSNLLSTEILELFPVQGEWQDGGYFVHRVDANIGRNGSVENADWVRSKSEAIVC